MSEWEVKLNRWLGTAGFFMPGVTLSPVRYSRNAMGGPYRAELAGTGDEISLWSGMSALGAGVRIYDRIMEEVWWGYIHETVLPLGAVTLTASLDNLRNRVMVLYTTIDLTTGDKSGPQETAWEYDTESILRYGLRELIYSQDGISETEAVSLRHTLLLAMKDPHPVISLSGGGGLESKLTCQCRGWWDGLNARYYKKLYTETGYRDTGVGIFRFGTTTQQMAGMSFQVLAAMSLKYVTLALSKSGTLTDTLTAAIYSDSSGSPGTLLGTSDAISQSALTTDVWTDIKFLFQTAISLSSSTSYWIVVDRTGTNSDTNFYTVDTNQACGYALGAMKYYSGSAWASPATAQDMLFSVSDGTLAAVVDTTAVVEQIIEAYGTVVDLSTADVITESGIDASPLRDGKKTAMAEIVELLEKGSTNYRRMLARVLSNKRVEIYEEPATTASGYIDRAGKIYSQYGSAMRVETCPVGIWLSLKGVIPVGASWGGVSGETVFFVEQSEYDVTAGTLSLTPKELQGSQNFLVVGNG